MGFPAALAGIGGVASLAGGIVGGIGAQQKGQAEAAMYNYQAGVAQINAQIARQDASYALASGEVSAEQSGMRTRAEIGQTRAAFGASNVAGASQGKVVQSETEIGQQNQGIIRANAAKRAYGFEVTAAQDVAQAGAYKVAAKTSEEAGQLGMISSILGGVGSVSSKWLQSGPAFGWGSPSGGGPSDQELGV